MTATWEITAQTLLAGARILAKHPEGMRGQDLWTAVVQQLPNLESEWSNASAGTTTAYRNFDFYSINLVKAGWIPEVWWALVSHAGGALGACRAH